MASLEIAPVAVIAPEDKPLPIYVDEQGIRDRLGLKLSRSSIYLAVRDGRLPLPQRMAPGKSAKRYWKVSELLEAIAKWPQDKPDPAA